MDTKQISLPPQWEAVYQKKREAVALVQEMIASGELEIAWLSNAEKPNVNGHKNTVTVSQVSESGETQVEKTKTLVKEFSGQIFTVNEVWGLPQRLSLEFKDKGVVSNILWKMAEHGWLKGFKIHVRGKGRRPTQYRYDP